MLMKRAWLVLFGALFVAVPLRIFQLVFFVDYDTGFFMDDGVISTSLTLFLLCACAVIMFMCFREKHSPKRYPPMQNLPAGVTAGITGAAALVHSIVTIVNFAKPPAGMAAAVSAGQKYLSIILGLVGLVAGVIWLVTAVGYFRGKNIFRDMPYFALVPPIWLCLNLVALILNYTSYANFTENIYDMLTVMLMLLFVFSRAKLLAGVRLFSTGKRVYAFGLPAVLLAAITTLPNCLLPLLGKAPISGLSATFSLVLAALALYGGVHLWALQKVPEITQPEELPEPEPDEPTQDAEEASNEEEPPRAPRPVPPWEQEEEEPDVEEIIDLPKTPAIYKFKDPPRKKKKKKKKKKKVPLFRRLLLAVRKLFRAPKTPEELEEEARVTWKPSQLDEPATKTLEQDWFLDYYGFERKDGQAYIPKVHDIEPQKPADPPEKPSDDT